VAWYGNGPLFGRDRTIVLQRYELVEGSSKSDAHRRSPFPSKAFAPIPKSVPSHLH
jgi:hypothetical protein